MRSREEIIETARGFLDWGWGHQRRGPDRIDCVGLPIMVARRLDMVSPDFNITGYSRTADLDRLVGIFRRYMREKNRLEARPGDLVIVRDTVFPCHCGIVAEMRGALTFIHARAAVAKATRGAGLYARGKVREDTYRPWSEVATHAFEFPGVEA